MGKSRLKKFEKLKDLYELSLKHDDNSHIAIEGMLTDNEEYMDDIMSNPAIKYINETKNLYDILILPTTLSIPYISLAHFLNVPLVQVATSHPMPWQNEAIGNPNYISTDHTLLLHPNSENFYGRLVKFIKGFKILYRYHFSCLPNLNKHSTKYFPSETPKIEEISANTSLLLVNTQPPMVMVRPKVPNYIEIGGIQCRPAEDLPPELDSFVQHSEGVIYMSLGLTINSTFPQRVLKSILNVFRKLPQRVIFKLGQKVDDVPSNVLISNSCPQQDILGNRQTKLFITQGGMLSLQEALYHGVPMLVLPLSMDQPTNAQIVAKLGYGRYLQWTQFSEDTFLREINEVLSNPKYAKRVRESSKLTRDVPKGPKENLKWWIDYVMRYKGFPLSKYNRHEYNRPTFIIDFDILIFILFVIVLLSVLSVLSVVFVLRFVANYGKFKKE